MENVATVGIVENGGHGKPRVECNQFDKLHSKIFLKMTDLHIVYRWSWEIPQKCVKYGKFPLSVVQSVLGEKDRKEGPRR